LVNKHTQLRALTLGLHLRGLHPFQLLLLVAAVHRGLDLSEQMAEQVVVPVWGIKIITQSRRAVHTLLLLVILQLAPPMVAAVILSALR
jgi:hypothetical protein